MRTPVRFLFLWPLNDSVFAVALDCCTLHRNIDTGLMAVLFVSLDASACIFVPLHSLPRCERPSCFRALVFSQAGNRAPPAADKERGEADRLLEPDGESTLLPKLAKAIWIRHIKSKKGWRVRTHHNRSSRIHRKGGSGCSQWQPLSGDRVFFRSISSPCHFVTEQIVPVGHTFMARGSPTESMLLTCSLWVDVVDGSVEDLYTSAGLSDVLDTTNIHSHPRRCLRAMPGLTDFGRGLHRLSESAPVQLSLGGQLTEGVELPDQVDASRLRGAVVVGPDQGLEVGHVCHHAPVRGDQDDHAEVVHVDAAAMRSGEETEEGW